MTARPCDSGRRDVLGRAIKVSAGDVEQRPTAPSPAAVDDGDDVCRRCGEANDDGEGWDGLCGNCADIDTQLDELRDTFEDLNIDGRRQALIDWVNDRYPNTRPGVEIVDGLLAEHGSPRSALRELRDQIPALDSVWADNLATRTLNDMVEVTMWDDLPDEAKASWTAANFAPAEAAMWAGAGFYPGEAVRLRAAGVFPHKAAGYTRGGIRRVDAIVAWDRAGWQPSDAVRMAARGFPGPAIQLSMTPPNRARYDSLSALVADSFSEADHRAGRARPAPPTNAGMVAVAGRAWDGSPTTAAAAYQPASLPGFAIAGASADTERAVRDRVRAALINSGLQWPAGQITVTVTGDLDSRSDAAIAAAVAASSGQIAPPPGELWGELGLNGTIHDIEH